MKLAMAQMSMTGSMDENLKRSLAFCDAAAGSDLLFFPEVQLTPFFPQYAGRNVDAYVVPAGSPTVRAFAGKARAHGRCRQGRRERRDPDPPARLPGPGARQDAAGRRSACWGARRGRCCICQGQACGWRARYRGRVQWRALGGPDLACRQRPPGVFGIDVLKDRALGSIHILLSTPQEGSRRPLWLGAPSQTVRRACQPSFRGREGPCGRANLLSRPL